MSFPVLRARTPGTRVDPYGGVKPIPAVHPDPKTRVSKISWWQQIRSGLFGEGHAQIPQVIDPTKGDIYHYHQGDLFTPGAMNYVFDPPFDLPLQTIWGQGFLRQPNTFNPLQPPPFVQGPNIVVNGIGGLVAGQMAFQPLEVQEEF